MTTTLSPGAQPSLPAAQDTTSASIAATRATAFLEAQAQWLQRGLQQGGDPIVVGIVLGAHDRSHERWLTLIDLVCRSLGSEAAQEVAALYAHVGRVAGSLEHAAMDLLPAEIATSARRLLAQRLDELTEAAVETLRRAAREA